MGFKTYYRLNSGLLFYYNMNPYPSIQERGPNRISVAVVLRENDCTSGGRGSLHPFMRYIL
jgi:hypothetical protein